MYGRMVIEPEGTAELEGRMDLVAKLDEARLDGFVPFPYGGRLVEVGRGGGMDSVDSVWPSLPEG